MEGLQHLSLCCLPACRQGLWFWSGPTTVSVPLELTAPSDDAFWLSIKRQRCQPHAPHLMNKTLFVELREPLLRAYTPTLNLVCSACVCIIIRSKVYVSNNNSHQSSTVDVKHMKEILFSVKNSKRPLKYIYFQCFDLLLCS